MSGPRDRWIAILLAIAFMATPVAAQTRAALGAPFVPSDHIPINLATALQLANVQPIDIALASQRVQAAAAQLDRAKLLWLPTVYLGSDYARHDGQLQDVGGRVFTASKSSLMVGAGPSAVFAVTDAIYAPLAARQDLRGRDAVLQAARNDTMLSVAEAFFNVQQARGYLAGAEDVGRRTEELVRRAEKLAPGLVPPVEAVRARTELARRKQAVHLAKEQWQVASAELARVLRLQTTSLIEPMEPPHLLVPLLDHNRPVDELVPLALANRPELAANQAFVQASIDRWKQEKMRPFMPSVLLRGNATNPGGTLSGGYFGGGINDQVSNFAARGDFDAQLVWELQNLGFGNLARVRERRADKEIATLELVKTQDRIVAEVAQALAQTRSAAARTVEAEAGLKDAIESAEKNFEGLNQTRRLGGEIILLVIRPQEVVAALQALGQAYNDYYATVADFDRAQFRLYRALGQPAQALRWGE